MTVYLHHYGGILGAIAADAAGRGLRRIMRKTILHQASSAAVNSFTVADVI